MSEVDKVNPSHYMCGKIESVEHIRAVLTPEEFRGFLKGNLLKYIIRAGRKEGEPADTDYAKAAWFKERLNHYFQ